MDPVALFAAVGFLGGLVIACCFALLRRRLQARASPDVFRAGGLSTDVINIANIPVARYRRARPGGHGARRRVERPEDRPVGGDWTGPGRRAGGHPDRPAPAARPDALERPPRRGDRGAGDRREPSLHRRRAGSELDLTLRPRVGSDLPTAAPHIV